MFHPFKFMTLLFSWGLARSGDQPTTCQWVMTIGKCLSKNVEYNFKRCVILRVTQTDCYWYSFLRAPGLKGGCLNHWARKIVFWKFVFNQFFQLSFIKRVINYSTLLLIKVCFFQFSSSQKIITCQAFKQTLS